jgi:hypothetical protein
MTPGQRFPPPVFSGKDALVKVERKGSKLVFKGLEHGKSVFVCQGIKEIIDVPIVCALSAK